MSVSVHDVPQVFRRVTGMVQQVAKLQKTLERDGLSMSLMRGNLGLCASGIACAHSLPGMLLFVFPVAKQTVVPVFAKACGIPSNDVQFAMTLINAIFGDEASAVQLVSHLPGWDKPCSGRDAFVALITCTSGTLTNEDVKTTALYQILKVFADSVVPVTSQSCQVLTRLVAAEIVQEGAQFKGQAVLERCLHQAVYQVRPKRVLPRMSTWWLTLASEHSGNRRYPAKSAPKCIDPNAMQNHAKFTATYVAMMCCTCVCCV